MEEHVIVDLSFSTIINARLEQMDIPSWCFSLPDDEYQCFSPVHFAAGSTAGFIALRSTHPANRPRMLSTSTLSWGLRDGPAFALRSVSTSYFACASPATTAANLSSI